MMSLNKSLFTMITLSVLLVACGNDQAVQEKDATVTDQSEMVGESTDEGATDKPVAEAEEEPELLYEINPDTFQVVPLPESDAPEKATLLTYDDAPDGHALQIAQAVDDKGEKAIFFVNGMYLDEKDGEETLKAIHDLGFEIGNHTYYHPDLTTLSYEEQRKEIVGTNDRVEEIIGVRPRFIRPPFGLYNEDTVRIANEENMTIMNWSYGYDWEVEYQNPEALADIMVNTEFLGNGANLLMHDRSWTLQATPAIIDGLKDKGYSIVDPATIQSGQQEVKVSRGHADE